MEAVTIPRVCIPSVSIGGICLPGIGVPDGGKKGLVWPKGLKESIKAIYDPAKQGMSNYDVIEAYAEDFTTWNKDANAAVTNNSLSCTIALYSNLLYKVSTKKIQAMSVYIDDVVGINYSKFQYYYVDENKEYKFINLHKGINELPESYIGDVVQVVGFRYLEKPASEITITIKQLPTSILKDLSGNGNHAYLYGGKGKLNSGIGLYTYDYNSDRWSSTGRADYIITKKGFEFTNIIEDGGIIFALGSNIAKEGDKVKVKISGIPNGGRVYFGTWITATEDGEYFGTYAYDNNGNTTIGTLGCIGATITLEFIPDYPHQLCYDGKMYAVCYGFPILTDYTVMADRTWFDKTGSFVVKGSSPNYGFVFERFDTDLERVQSLGAWNTVAINTDSGISYLTKNKYNSSDIKNGIGIDDDILCIGAYYNKKTGIANLFSSVAHGKIIIADRSFTEDEITWLKDNWKKI